MQFTALQIATLIKGRIEGNPEVKVTQVARIEDAGAGSLSFIANPKYEEHLYTTKASVIIINDTLEVTRAVTPTHHSRKGCVQRFCFFVREI